MMPTALRLTVIFCLCFSLLSCGQGDSKSTENLERINTFIEQGKYSQAGEVLKSLLAERPDDTELLYGMGQVLELQNDWQGAAAQYRKILKLDNNHVDARVKLGHLYLVSGNKNHALTEARTALNLSPESADALTLMGNIELRSSNFTAARDYAEKALAINSKKPNAILLMASVLMQEAKTDEAIELLTKSIKQFPEETGLQLSLAGAYASQKEIAKAEAVLQPLIKKHPNSLSSRAYLARVYAENDQIDNAEDTLRLAIREIPENKQTELLLIKFLTEHRSPAVARDELLGMIEQNPADYSLQYALARLHESMAEDEAAVAVYEKIISQQADNENGIAAKNFLANYYTRHQQIEKSRQLLEEILQQDASNFDALVHRGRIAFDDADLKLAIEHFQSALKIQPDSVLLHRYLARSYAANNDLKAAVASMEKAIELSANDLALREEYTRLLAAREDADAVIQELNEILEIEPGNLNALQTLFRIYSAKKDWQLAGEVAEKIKQAHPENAIGYHYAGQVLQVQSKIEESIGDFEKALELSPGAIQPLTDLVKSYLSLKQSGKAQQRLHDAIAQNKEHYVAWNLLGEVLIYEKQFGNALGAFNRAQALKPDWALPYRNMANVYLIQNDESGAESIYKTGIEKAQQVLLLVTELGQLYTKQDRFDDAIKVYEDALLKEGSNPIVNNNLVMLLIDKRDDEASLKKAAGLIGKLSGNNSPLFLDTRGWFHYKNGEFDKAVTLLEQATAAMPDSKEVQYHLGMSYFKKGDSAAAEAALRRAIDKGDVFAGYEDARKTILEIQASGKPNDTQ